MGFSALPKLRSVFAVENPHELDRQGHAPECSFHRHGVLERNDIVGIAVQQQEGWRRGRLRDYSSSGDRWAQREGQGFATSLPRGIHLLRLLDHLLDLLDFRLGSSAGFTY